MGKTKSAHRKSQNTPRQKVAKNRGNSKGKAAYKTVYAVKKASSSDLIVGRRAVLEAIESDVPLKNIIIASGLKDSEALKKIVSLSKKLGIKTDFVNRNEIDRKASGLNHQGVIALAKPFDYASLEEIINECENNEAALIYVLDHIEDCGNLGAIIRSAEVLDSSGVVIANRRSAQVSPATYKASAGAALRVAIARVANISQAIKKLQDAGFWVVASSEKASKSCWESKIAGKTAIVLGNENKGISELVEQNCDESLCLVQRGEIGSLNVSNAACAMGYEWLRQCTALKTRESS